MAIDTQAAMLVALRDWLARPGDTSTLPDTALLQALSFCEADVNARLRTPDFEATADVVFTAQTANLPTDFAEVRRFYLSTAPGGAEYLSPAVFWAKFALQNAGMPLFYTIENGQFVLGPAPDASTTTGKLLYWKIMPALGTGTNPVLSKNQDLYLYGTLAHLAAYIQTDDRIPVWRGGYEAALKRAQGAGDRAAWGGSSLTMRPA